MKKKLLAILLILMMLVTAFAGCSGNESGRKDKEDKVESRDDREDDEEDNEDKEDDRDKEDVKDEEKDDQEKDISDLLDELLNKDNDDESDDENKVSQEEKVIEVMSFTDEVPYMVQRYLDMHPELGYTMRATIVATTDMEYQPALDEMLKTNAPDIYALEAGFVAKYTKGDASGFAAAYDDLGIDTNRLMRESKTATYAAEVGTRPADGRVVALPYQSSGGCFIYRRSVAIATWGTDDPAVVQQKIGGGTGKWDMFWDAAEELKAKGFAIVSGDGDIWRAMENSADKGWIVDGKLYLDPKREAFLDVAKMLLDNNYHNGTKDWMNEWFEDMKGNGPKEVLGFFGPAWLINYTMGDNCGDNKDTPEFEGTYGDWAVCNSPVGFFWGGTWVASGYDVVNQEKKDVVADIIQWMTLDYDSDSLQYMWANGSFYGPYGTADAVTSGTVMKKTNGSSAFLGGQNMFEYYVKANEYATGNNVTPYDERINMYWRQAVQDYVNGNVSRSEAIRQFADMVKYSIGIEVPDELYKR